MFYLGKTFIADEVKAEMEDWASRCKAFMEQSGRDRWICLSTRENPDAVTEVDALVTGVAYREDLNAIIQQFLVFASWLKCALEIREREPLGERLYEICGDLVELVRQMRRMVEL